MQGQNSLRANKNNITLFYSLNNISFVSYRDADTQKERMEEKAKKQRCFAPNLYHFHQLRKSPSPSLLAASHSTASPDTGGTCVMLRFAPGVWRFSLFENLAYVTLKRTALSYDSPLAYRGSNPSRSDIDPAAVLRKQTPRDTTHA